MRVRRGTGVDAGMVWERASWRSDHRTALIVYLSGVITMIAAGVFLILMGPQG